MIPLIICLSTIVICLMYSRWRYRIWHLEGFKGTNPQQAHERTVEPEEEDAILFRRLYYELQNPEKFAENLPQYRHHMISLLSGCLYECLHQSSQSPTGGILAVQTYAESRLTEFLTQEHNKTFRQWEVYLSGRKTGKGPDLFRTKDEAKSWLKQIAPLKYVDGAWLSHVHRINTPFPLRSLTKRMWQILSEEWGDGDLKKNHVFVYRKLMDDVKAELPDGDSIDFIREGHGLDSHGVWKAAVAQLLISLFPNEFLPEMLGFNMHFELTTLDTLKAMKELKELGLDNYYFLLHVSIDNAHSGHTAMALKAVTSYMDHIERTEGPETSLQTWKRLQAGYVLSETLGQKQQPKHTLTHKRDSRIIEMFKGKGAASQMAHCASRAKIGPYSLVAWLSPAAWDSPAHQKKFLTCLSNAKPWVIRGHSRKSLLIKELSWGGKMFGAFTHRETYDLMQWIDHLDDHTKTYWAFTGREEPSQQELLESFDAEISSSAWEEDADLTDYEDIFLSTAAMTVPLTTFEFQPLYFSGAILRMDLFLPLWFTHPCLLENFIDIPFRSATPFSATVLRILRAENGFSAETDGVKGFNEPEEDGPLGLVELGQEMAKSTSQPAPNSLHDILASQETTDSFPYKMLRWSKQPVKNRGLLLGLCRAFLDLERWVAQSGILSLKGETCLKDIVRRKTDALAICLDELSPDRQQHIGIVRGYRIGRLEIDSCMAKCCLKAAVVAEERIV